MTLLFRLTLFLFISGSTARAWWPVVKLHITARNEFNGSALSGVTLEILKDGKKFLTKTSLADGRFPVLELRIEHVYALIFRKEGYVTKVAEVNACDDHPAFLGPIVYGLMEVSLFIPVPGVDYTFLETTPMAKFYIDYSSKQLVYNHAYTDGMLAEIAKRINEEGTLKRNRQLELNKRDTPTEKQIKLTEPKLKIEPNRMP